MSQRTFNGSLLKSNKGFTQTFNPGRHGALGDTFTAILTVTADPGGVGGGALSETVFYASELVGLYPNDFFKGCYIRGYLTAAGAANPTALAKISTFVEETAKFTTGVNPAGVYAAGEVLHIVPAWMVPSVADDAVLAALGAPVGADLSHDIAAVKADAVVIDGLVDTLTTNLTTANAGIVTVDGLVDTLTTNLATANAGIVTVDGLVDTLTTDLATANAGIVTVDGLVDTLTTNLATANAGIVTTDGKADIIATAVGTTIPGTVTTLQNSATAIKAKTDLLPLGGVLLVSPDGATPNTPVTATTGGATAAWTLGTPAASGITVPAGGCKLRGVFVQDLGTATAPVKLVVYDDAVAVATVYVVATGYAPVDSQILIAAASAITIASASSDASGKDITLRLCYEIAPA